MPFRAGDGFSCNLVNLRGERAPTKGAVILVHGAGVRANLFRAPVRTTIVDYLIAHCYDVWLETGGPASICRRIAGRSIRRRSTTTRRP